MAEKERIAGPDVAPIAADSSVNESMARFPATGAILVQHGPLFEAPSADPYLRYRDCTIAEFAEKHGLCLARLLRQLNAEAEGAGRGTAGSAGPARRRRTAGFAQTTIGYTGSYAERPDLEIDERPVVAAQTASARGPE